MSAKSRVISMVFPVFTLLFSLWHIFAEHRRMVVPAAVCGAVSVVLTAMGTDTSGFFTEKIIFTVIYSVLWYALLFWAAVNLRTGIDPFFFMYSYTAAFFTFSAVYFWIRSRDRKKAAVLILSNPALVLMLISLSDVLYPEGGVSAIIG